MDLDKLREICLSFPGATEGVKWEDHICFMVAEKMFCVTGDFGGASLKVTPEEFDEMIERDGIGPQAYMARNKWVRVEDFKKLKDKEWTHYLQQSYDLVAAKLPKKVREALK